MPNNASDATRMPDVVLFTPTLAGGVGRVISSLARGMQQKHVAVEIWTLADGEYANETAAALPLRYIQSRSALTSIPTLTRMIRTHRPRTVLSAAFHVNCAAILASFFVRTKPRIAIADHPSLDAALEELPFARRWFMRVLIRVLYPRADVHIAISNGVAAAMARYGGLERHRIHVIPNPVISDDLFKKSKEYVSHPFFETEDPIVLYVGRLSKEKDVDNLVQAFALARKEAHMRLLIIGDGPERAALEKTVQELGIGDYVDMPGAVVNPYPFFVRADVFALPSRREGLPTVLIEALALGTKVVSTDCPSGPREILRNGTYGTLVPIDDPEALAEGIVQSLTAQKKTVPEVTLSAYRTETAVAAYMHTLQLSGR